MTLAAIVGCKGPKKKVAGLTQSQEQEFNRVYIDGVSELILKNYKQSDSLFKICLNLKPDESAVYFMRAKVFCSTSKFDQALSDLDYALTLEPDNVEVHILHADVLAHKGNYKEAGSELEVIYSKFPKKSSFARQSIDYYLSGGLIPQALNVFNVMEMQFGIREDIILGKESLLSSTNRFEEAAIEVSKLIEKYPNRYSYLEKLSSIYQRAGNYNKCEETITRLLVLDPENGFGLLTMADIWLRKNNVEKEFDYLSKAFAIPSIAFEIKQSAITGYSLKHPNAISDGKLLLLAEIISKTHPSVPLAQAIYADVFFENKQYSNALPFYRSILKDFKSNSEIYRKYLVCFEQMSMWDSLSFNANNSLELFPNQFVFYFLSAEGLFKIKNYESALIILKTGRNFGFNPNDLLQSSLLEADILDSKGDIEKCREVYKELIINNAGNSLVLNNFAFHLAKTKHDLDNALEMALKAMKAEPANSSFMDTYAWVLFAKENYLESKVYIDKALKIDSLNAEILEHAGDIYFKNELKEKALEFWIQSKQKGGNGINLDRKISERKWYG